ncbi:hypothetical protein ENUP19_0154G0015 [Entamoeba nuttalli]|uniref:Uncharacterized protein n=2 Tax=Entamoeba nuttalli TaxID=412467 RepID=K2GB29_ENTNP|nr:hypothetical protein ENU1_118640 [Entamoeba nuttalli P19]EKE39686.1 hypothetical protein ENU1_118640 [Entamoeba nuttalli P19]|eukprot:XP_008857980.1 hypothetical protein ENU1_118640 [Entamoeba nuttalli P19]
MHTMSVFVPVPHGKYQIVTNENNTNTNSFSSLPTTPTISSTPSTNITTNSLIKPKKYIVQLSKSFRSKKNWKYNQKVFAIKKASELGLTKAIKFLQIQYPEVYEDLSLSTLQYWIQHIKNSNS